MRDTSELEFSRLALLNYLAERKVKMDGLCAYCGFRPASGQLCAVCEGRRKALKHRYPGVAMQRVFHPPDGMTRLYEAAPKERTPYREDE